VSVVIPVLDEERHILGCIQSVLKQTYPAVIEIAVADGGSRDATRSIVDALSLEDARIRLIDNPRGNQAAGLNLAIAATHGEIVARLDGHAEWRPGHIARCVELLMESGADNVGGTMEGHGENRLGRAIAAATRSPFAVGGATYRYSTREQDVETVWLGCFWRAALERVGPFDEGAPPHEDYELNRRIRETGGRIRYSPMLPTLYWTRNSWASLARQYFRYGRAKARVGAGRPGIIRAYHLVPPVAVVAMVLGLALSLRPGVARRLWLSAAAAYGATALVAAAAVGGDEPIAVLARTPVVFPVIHMAWGLGFWAGTVDAVRAKLVSGRSAR
jgi:glycosyltransferase involved in cell wall biosynthesis